MIRPMRNQQPGPEGAEVTIELVEPDPTWPRQFAEIGRSLRASFGPRALRVDHIGSTAVPGLLAKDVIDIQVTVAALDGVADILAASGFDVWPDIANDHRPAGSNLPDDELVKVFAQAAAPRRVNLHVRLPGRFNQRHPLLSRDYLRSHPDATRAYGEVKRHLAWIVGDDEEAYYDIKDPVFDIIMTGAEAWAAATTWSPGPSDA
jgi:GrpB-like predicted nucleotidyltransferase (UPF0157 family)